MLRPHSLKPTSTLGNHKERSSWDSSLVESRTYLVHGLTMFRYLPSRYLWLVLGLLLTFAGDGLLSRQFSSANAAVESGLSDDGLQEEFRSVSIEPDVAEFSFSPSRSDALLLAQVPEVKRGDQGALVEALQERLRDLGYFSESITGFFGEVTESAVIRFQNDNGLTPDGIVGTGTTNSLRKAGPAGSQRRRDNPLTLEEGYQGPAVETLQNQLTTLGYYDGPITGYFGPLTETALIAFQSAKDLVTDGVVGNATQAAIDSALQSRSSASSTSTAAASTSATVDAPDPNDGVWETGETGDSVATLQRNLNTLGYYSRTIDGDFGSGTEAAVIEFQRSRNLTPDGKAGPMTLAALQTALEADASTTTVAPASASSSTASSSAGSRVSSLPPSSSSATQPSSGLAAANPSLAVGSAGVSDRNVLAVQQELQDQGFYAGELDGDLGPATRQAIQSAQQSYGLQRSDFD